MKAAYKIRLCRAFLQEIALFRVKIIAYASYEAAAF